MVMLYIAGQKVDWADAAKRFTEPAAVAGPVELHDEAGVVVARLTIRLAADDPDWVKAITPEEIQRRAEPFVTLAEFRARAGQQ